MRTLATSPVLDAIPYDLDVEADARQREARAIVVAIPDVDRAVAFMHALPRLELVQALSAGYEQWVGRLPDGVRLANVRGVHGIGVAEWVVAVLLSHFREIPDFARAQREQTWRSHSTDSLHGKRVAILGAGDLGQRTSAHLKAFECDVVLVGRSPRDGVVTMDDFARTAHTFDVVVLALPLSRETTGIVGATFLDRLQGGTVIVNAGRGPLIDTDALLNAAGSGHVCGILDVVDPEPLPDDHPLWRAPGVVITPHVAGAVPQVWPRAWRRAVVNLEAFAAGRAPADLTEER